MLNMKLCDVNNGLWETRKDFPWRSDVFAWMHVFVWVVDCGEAKGWLRSRNLSVNPEAETHGERMKVCLCPPRSRLMHVNDTRLCSLSRCACLRNAQAPLCCACVPAQSVCLFYFPCCLTCGWLIAFRVLTGPGAWLSSPASPGDVFRLCVWSCVCGCCVCVCVCAVGGRVSDPSLISSTPACLFSQPRRNLCADVMWPRAVSII